MKKKALTLIELITAIALASLLSGLVLASLWVFLRAWEKIAIENALAEQSGYIFDQIKADLGAAVLMEDGLYMRFQKEPFEWEWFCQGINGEKQRVLYTIKAISQGNEKSKEALYRRVDRLSLNKEEHALGDLLALSIENFELGIIWDVLKPAEFKEAWQVNSQGFWDGSRGPLKIPIAFLLQFSLQMSEPFKEDFARKINFPSFVIDDY